MQSVVNAPQVPLGVVACSNGAAGIEPAQDFNRPLVRSVMFPRGHADGPGAVLVSLSESPFTERVLLLFAYHRPVRELRTGR
jgi:hypothetical protein